MRSSVILEEKPILYLFKKISMVRTDRMCGFRDFAWTFQRFGIFSANLFRKRFLVPLFFLLCGCGGGGGSGSSGNTDLATQQTQQTTANQETQSPDPVWSLERAIPSSVGMDSEAVDAVLDHIYTDTAVQAALVVKLGRVIGERYAENYDGLDRGTSWSVAKSFYAAAIGAAIDSGFISSLDQRASDYLTEWIGTNKEEITVRQLMEMRAGLPGDTGLFVQSDQTTFSLELELDGIPGASFVYSNPSSQLFEPLLRRATGLSAHEYLRANILDPIGISSDDVGFWFDPTGVNPLTYCCLDMVPDDFARFGLLFSRGGEWNGSRVISQEFVTQSLSAQSPYYGLQWWVLNSSYFGSSVPTTISAAHGIDGQHIYVWPAEDLVVVVLSLYEHERNQGYVLSLTNWPNTCSGRNTCDSSTGNEVASYDERQLIDYIYALR